MTNTNLVRRIIDTLIRKGIIPSEHREMAERELDIEMTRHTQRVLSELAEAATAVAGIKRFLEG